MSFKGVMGFGGLHSYNVCWRCVANTGDIPWHDFKSNAKWKSMRHTNTSFFQMRKNHCGMICPLFNIPRFVTTMLMVDCLHTLDLGVTQDMIGCLFYYCIMNTKMFSGRSTIDRFNELWSRIKQYYKDANPLTKL